MCTLPTLGKVDTKAGEFWVDNPFEMPAKGHNLSAYERNRVFLNLRGQEFIDASRFSSVDIDSDSRSVIAADFDRDGRIDLLVGNVGGGPLRLFLNRIPQNANRTVRIELQGLKSNRSAIGARCEIRCGDNRIIRDVFAANGCMGQAPPEMLVGLGSSPKIDKLIIRWPTGNVQEFTDLAVDSIVKVLENESSVQVTSLKP